MICGAKCPGSSRVCERHDDHTEHQTTLSPPNWRGVGATVLYWFGDDFPVSCRSGVVESAVRAEATP